VRGVCAVRVGDRNLLASASDDRTVRIWNPTTGQPRVRIPVYSQAASLAFVSDQLVIGIHTGLLAIHIADLFDQNK
jgi:WD40 repeat protein